MTRTTLFSFAAVAILAAACERHPASELAGEHEGVTHATEPANPAGAAPVDEKAATPPPAAAPAEPGKAPAYFPPAK